MNDEGKDLGSHINVALVFDGRLTRILMSAVTYNKCANIS